MNGNSKFFQCFIRGMGIALPNSMPKITQLKVHKYKYKLKNSKSLWSLSMTQLLEELKHSLDDVSVSEPDPSLDLWIDAIVMVVGTKFGPGTSTQNNPSL